MPLHRKQSFKKALTSLSLTVSALGFSSVATAQDAPLVYPAINDIGVKPSIEKEPQALPFKPLRAQEQQSQEQQSSDSVSVPQTSPVEPAPARKMAGMPSRNMMDMAVSDLPSIADLVDRVSPSVVNIIVTTETGETTSEGQGSGFIISTRNEVVTNYHVIDGGTNIEVEFNDGRRYPARILGTDEETDLALLQIKTQEQIPHVSFKTQNDSRIGDWVVAIGNPFGIGQSTSLGVISAIGRERVESGSYVDYIQTDATINRGNSGGPLFNLEGEVVGVNSAIYSPTGASVGIAFVIPHHTASEVVTALRADGRVRRGYLGAALRDAEFEIEGRPGVFKAGALVNSVVPGSPADLYGLQVDDIILQINDDVVTNSVEATRAVGAMTPGQVGRFVFERNEEPYALNVSIGERPDKYDVDTARAESQGLPPPPPKEPAHGTINIDTGLQVLDISAEFRTAIRMRSDQVGIYVESVTPGSGAERGGFSSGMVLMEADGMPLAETDVFRTAVLNARIANQSDMVIEVKLKNGQETTMILPLD